MVEATIYMPIVLCVVMSLIYLALFNMQEYMMLYEAQRVAAVAAREDAYIGYDTFGMGSDNEIEFKNGADLTSAGKVNAYMEAHNESMSALYRGAGKLVSAITGGHASAQAQNVAGTVSASSLVATTWMSDGSTTLKAAAYTFSINPSEFVRNVDLAEDLTKAIFDKLGLDYGSFTSKTQSVLQKIL